MVKPYFSLQKEDKVSNPSSDLQKVIFGSEAYAISPSIYQSALEAARQATKRIIEENRENFLKNYKV